MLKNESMKAKKKKRRARRVAGLSNRKKVGLGWDSCKCSRGGFIPRNSTEAKAHQIVEKEEISGLEKILKLNNKGGK